MAKNRLKDPPTWLKVATTLEKPPAPTHDIETRYFYYQYGDFYMKTKTIQKIISQWVNARKT